MIKVIFFDIDGTVLSHNGNAHVVRSTVKAFEKLREKGIRIVAATGRFFYELPQLPIDELVFDDYLTLNGKLNLDKDGNYVDGDPFNKEARGYALDLFNSHDFPVQMVEEKVAYMNYVDDQVVSAFNRINTPISPIGVNTGKDIYQIVVFGDESKDEEILARLPGCRFTRWNPNAVDIMYSDGGKGQAILRYLAKNGYKVEESMAFGDGDNDIDMLEVVGIGVAMGNSYYLTKEVANYVTDDIDEDGLYNALKHFSII